MLFCIKIKMTNISGWTKQRTKNKYYCKYNSILIPVIFLLIYSFIINISFLSNIQFAYILISILILQSPLIKSFIKIKKKHANLYKYSIFYILFIESAVIVYLHLLIRSMRCYETWKA